MFIYQQILEKEKNVKENIVSLKYIYIYIYIYI